MLCQTLSNWVTFWKDSHDDAGAISGTDTSLHVLEGWKFGNPSGQFLGRVCTSFTGNHLIPHPLSSITNPPFVGPRPRQPLSPQNTPDWLHFTSGDGREFGRIAQTRKLYH